MLIKIKLSVNNNTKQFMRLDLLEFDWVDMDS